jgi:hypothetical protein
VTRVLAPEPFLAAARGALADPAPDGAMRTLLEGTVTALNAGNGQWIEQEEDEAVLATSAEVTVPRLEPTGGGLGAC